ncbi:MAG: hypothetical protein AAGG08_05390, partial [Actinomycetota bacterium]
MTILRPIGALASIALLAAGCAEQENSTPAIPSLPPAPTTIAPTTVEADAEATADSTATTSTSIPPTTAAPTTAPPSTVPPTTVVPVGDPTPASTPIFAGSSNDAWLYLGRWTSSGWERAFDDGGGQRLYDLADGIDVTISELGQVPVSGTAGPPGEACFSEGVGSIEGPIITPNAGVPDTPGFGYRAVAFPAAWNTDPREAVVIDETIQAYADAGLAAFVDTGVETQVGEVDQTVVSDLDGDGDTQVLVVYGHENERVEGQTEPVGGYSALLLIDADTGAVTEVEKSFTPTVGEGE